MKETAAPFTGTLEPGDLPDDTWVEVASADLYDHNGGSLDAGLSLVEVVNHCGGNIQWRGWGDANTTKSPELGAGAAQVLRGKVNADGEAIRSIWLRRPAASTAGVVQFECEP